MENINPFDKDWIDLDYLSENRVKFDFRRDK